MKETIDNFVSSLQILLVSTMEMYAEQYENMTTEVRVWHF